MEQSKTDKTYWHPAFYADIQIELSEDADNLEFENEHQLGTNPMEIDVLIIKKEADRPVKKNIGKIFRKYNIIEYKSPDDSLSVDDFYKVYGYTCFYKADVPLADSISMQELTITFVAEKYPRKLICHLQETKKYTIQRSEAGIYRVHGDLIPIQIIVTKELSRRKNLWLNSLTNKLSETENARHLVADYINHRKNNLYRSVIETIIRANWKTFEEVNGMGDIFMEFVQEKFDRKLKEAVEEETEKIKKQLTKSVTESVTKSVIEKTKLMEQISLIQKKCMKNKSLSVIADELETEPDDLLSLYNIVYEYPEKTVEELYELVTIQAS